MRFSTPITGLLPNRHSSETSASLWPLERRHTHVIHKPVGSASKRFRETPRPHAHSRECSRNLLLPSACISRLEDTAGVRGGSCLRRTLRVGLSPASLRGVPSGRPRMGWLALTSQGAE